jgi:hypothetical protein
VISIGDLSGKESPLFYSLLQLCNKEQEPCSKILSLESLALFIKKHSQACLNHESIQEILRIVAKHWEDTVDAINGKVRMILAHLIPQIEEEKFSLDICIQNILSMDRLSRAKYGILCGLLSLTKSELISEKLGEFISLIENSVLSDRIGDLGVEIAVCAPDSWISPLVDNLESQAEDAVLEHLAS